MNSLIQKEIDEGVDPSKIILCGFSQGAGIAIETGFGRDLPVGGIISFCGCLPNDQKFTVKEQAKKTPIMFSLLPISIVGSSMERPISTLPIPSSSRQLNLSSREA